MALLWLVLSTVTAEARGELPELSVDLHAHLFMKEGLGWLFRGDFDAVEADSWDDRLSSKVDARTLEDSGIGLVVVALFAHPLYVADMRASVRAQIAAAKRFVRRHRGWAIARSPAQARQLLESGKRVLVLSLEGASGVLETEADLREFIDREGIAIVTELHLVDDRYGGVASLDGFQYVANPLGVVDQILDHHQDAAGIEVNRRGLSPLGRRLAIELIGRGVWIDLTHASEASLKGLVPLLDRAGQPLLLTHAQLRSRHRIERAASDALLRKVAASRGFVGLLPSEDALGAPPSIRFCPAGCSPERCEGSLHGFAAVFTEAAAIVGPEALALGTDFNGGMRHLAAACGTGTELDAEAGYYHVGQTDLVWGALRKLGAPVPPHRVTLARFLAAWERVQPVALEARDERGRQLPHLPERQDQARGPSLGFRLGAAMVTGDTDGAAVLPMAELYIRKDMARDHPVEPMFYLLRARGELAKTFSDERIPYADAALAPVGVVARDGDSLLRGEASHLLLRHHAVLDQALRIRWAAVHGEAQSVIGLWKAPGEHDLFVALRADVLGYERIVHRSAAPSLDGLFLLGGGGGLGASLYPTEGWVIRLQSHVDADLSLLLAAPGDGVGYQSDVMVTGGLELGTADRGFTQFVEGRWYATQERWARSLFRDAPHLRAGVRLGF